LRVVEVGAPQRGHDWDLVSGQLRYRLGGPPAEAAVVSPDNVYAATGGWDDSIRVWDLRTGAALLRFAAHHVIHQIAWIPSAPPRLIVGTAGGDVICVELPGDEVRPGPMAPRGAGP